MCCRGVNCDPGFVLTRIYAWRRSLALLGLLWLLFSVLMTFIWIDKIQSTITHSDEEARLEVGVMTICVGNLIITFSLVAIMIRLSRYDTTVYTSPKSGDDRDLARLRGHPADFSDDEFHRREAQEIQRAAIEHDSRTRAHAATATATAAPDKRRTSSQSQNGNDSSSTGTGTDGVIVDMLPTP